MLDQMVESKSNAAENSRRGRFMAVTLVLAVAVVLTLWGRDLFAQDFGMNSGDLELSTLVAPPPPEDEPPPEPEKQPEKKAAPDVDIRKELIQNIMSSPVKPPDEIKTTRSNVQAMRENVKTMQGDTDFTNSAAAPTRGTEVVSSGTTSGLGNNTGTGTDDEDSSGTPPPPKPTPKPVPKTVSGGVLNGKATSLPKPAYPAAARAVRASGAVSVQVLISETGSVLSASAVSGHPLLRAAAEGAARGARFSPTMLSGQPVKVSGVITYNFVP